jgi:mRNA interferase RelE/StbE
MKELAALPTPIRKRIDHKILTLAMNPRPPGCKVMKEPWKGFHRVRWGDIRIIYRIEDNRLIVTVIKVGNRRDIYDR